MEVHLLSDLRKALKSPAFRSGLILTFGFCLIYILAPLRVIHTLKFFDDGVIDSFIRLRGKTRKSNKIVIVDIDEKSLAKLGQWPWPRRVMADLIYKLDDYGVKISGFDIVFAEPDRTSLKTVLAEELVKNGELATQLKELEGWDNDAVLSEAVAETNTVLGCAFILDERLKTLTPGATPFPDLDLTEYKFDFPMTEAVQPVGNIAQIAEESLSEGFFNAAPDQSGTVRKIPLFIRYNKQIFPSIVLEMGRLADEEAAEECLKIKMGEQLGGFHSINLCGKNIPVNSQGQMIINFRGPAHTFEYVSALDVIEGKVPGSVLKDKFVLIGTSALGLHDLRSSPFGVTPGTEILATALDNLIMGDPFELNLQNQNMLTIVIVLLGGIFVSISLSFTEAVKAAGTGFLLFVLIFAVDYNIFFRSNQLVYMGYAFFSLLFTYMMVILINYFYAGRDKRFLKKAFSLYLSKELVDQIVKDPQKLSLEGEEKTLSIMFTDIRSFSTFSEKLSASELSRFLNEYLTDMSEIAMKGRAYIDKFIGDAVMAFWGAPVSDTCHALNSIRVGLEMLDRLDQLREKWKSEGLPAIEIGIGINSGPVCVGNMGSQRQFNYTVMGDNVNLASRLEGLNKAYGTNMLVAENTYELVKDVVSCRLVDQVRVKGKTVPVKIYEPLCDGKLTEDKQKEVDYFGKVMNLYYKQKFIEAEVLLKQLMENNDEKLYQVYFERIQQFKKEPPGQEWDGVYTFTTK